MGALRLVITGASGHLGRALCKAALAAGHDVLAQSRQGFEAPAGVQLLQMSVDAPAMVNALRGADAVLHLAGPITGNEAEMQAGFVSASRALATQAAEAGLPHIVLASSVSLYAANSPHAPITEGSPPEPNPQGRDAYMRAKQAQEAALAEICAARNIRLTCLRIGAIWGAGRVWNAHLGLAAGPAVIRIGGAGPIPICHISRAAEAMLRAAERPCPSPLNILDADLPTPRRYLDALGESGWPRWQIPLGWRAFDLVAGALSPLSSRLPGLLRRPTLRARMMPQNWSGAAAQAALSLSPQPPFETLMRIETQGANP